MDDITFLQKFAGSESDQAGDWSKVSKEWSRPNILPSSSSGIDNYVIMRLKYQDPDAGVLSSSGYGVRYIYIYIAIIDDINEKAIWVIIRSGHSATLRGVDGRSW